MDFEQEEVVEEGESPFLENRRACRCPKSIQAIAKARGITCQRLFRTAYLRAGYPESVSRAIFALFSQELSAKRDAPIPLLVVDYCERARVMGSAGVGEVSEEKCFGCSLTDHGLDGVVGSYERIHPEITRETLKLHANDPRTMHSSAYPAEDVSKEDELAQDMIESGLLDTGNEDWQAMMRWDET